MGSRRLASFARRAAQVAASALADQPGAQGGGLAARPLDLLEELPGRVGEFVGEPLHVPGAARRVDHPGQVRLLEQDRRGVAGDPAGERVRQAERVVEGQHGDRVGAADPGGEQATVVRSMFTHGSRRVIITDEVTACWRCAPAAGAPQTSATRAHSRRAARSLAMVRNWSAVAAYRNSSWARPASTVSPASVSARR